MYEPPANRRHGISSLIEILRYPINNPLPDVVNIGRDWMNSHMSTVNVVERPVAMNFYSKAFPGLGGAILFGDDRI